jgi:hypothetical protein
MGVIIKRKLPPLQKTSKLFINGWFNTISAELDGLALRTRIIEGQSTVLTFFNFFITSLIINDNIYIRIIA